jgi:hypothetical protein
MKRLGNKLFLFLTISALALLGIGLASEPQGKSGLARGLCSSSIFESHDNADGIPDLRATSTMSYDARGLLVSEYVEVDRGVNGSIDVVQTWTNAYNKRGDPVMRTLQIDEDMDTEIENTLVETYDYDSRGLLTKHVVETCDLDASKCSRIVETFTRDHSGALLKIVKETFYQAEDQLATSTYTNDKRGNPVEIVLSIDKGKDGKVDQVNYYFNTFDKWGNFIAEHMEFDTDNSGDPDIIQDLTRELDARGLPVSQLRTVDKDADPETHEVYTTTWTYDSHRNILEIVEESDLDADGVVDQRSVRSFIY